MARPMKVELIRPGMKLMQSDGTSKTVREAKHHPFRSYIPVLFEDGTKEQLPVNTLVEVQE